MKRVNFTDINIGNIISFERKKSDNDIQRLVKLSGDQNPLHIVKDFGKVSVFGKNIVHGMLLASFFSKIVGMYF